MLRDPAARAYSHYLMDHQLGIVMRSFADELREDLKTPVKEWGRTRMYLEHGMYFEHVKRYLDLFGAERVRIYFSDDLRNRRSVLLRDLYNFLEVASEPLPQSEANLNQRRAPRFPRLNYWLHRSGLKRPNSSAMLRRLRSRIAPMLYKPAPKLSEADRAMMLEFFADDIRKLQDLLSRDLSAWLR